MATLINAKCNLCAACAPLCPTQSISKGTRVFVIDTDTCSECLICMDVCPVAAVENPLRPPKKTRGGPRKG